MIEIAVKFDWKWKWCTNYQISGKCSRRAKCSNGILCWRYLFVLEEKKGKFEAKEIMRLGYFGRNMKRARGDIIPLCTFAYKMSRQYSQLRRGIIISPCPAPTSAGAPLLRVFFFSPIFSCNGKVVRCRCRCWLRWMTAAQLPSTLYPCLPECSIMRKHTMYKFVLFDSVSNYLASATDKNEMFLIDAGETRKAKRKTPINIMPLECRRTWKRRFV